ncbi:MAG: phosphotransferase [Planctomycetes bacterium]|nr:phosphotransferase [Planctomycetota bacterium]
MSSDSGASPNLVTAAGTLSPREISDVLAQYDIGTVESVRPFLAGSSRAPKAKLTTQSGAYLLKRLAPSRSSLDALKFQHALLKHLTKSGFPVAEVIHSTGSRTTVQLEANYYEMSRWVSGHRYGYVSNEARSCGAAMAALHDLAAPMLDRAPLHSGFHDRVDVARALNALTKGASDVIAPAYVSIGAALRRARRLVRSHWLDLPAVVAHGDWHPGNLLMGKDRVAAVIDFESTRKEPRVGDIANGLLQFSLERKPKQAISEWPVTCDFRLIAEMQAGYQLVSRDPLTEEEIVCIPSLMVEALAAESIIAIHRRGRIRKMTPEAVIPWIADRLQSIESNGNQLMEILRSRRGVS